MSEQMLAAENHLILIIVFITLDLTSAVDYIRACVFNSEAGQRTNMAKFTIADIDFDLCTHYIYSHASLDPVNRKVAAVDPSAETIPFGLYDQFNNAKRYFPKIRTLLTVGGPGETFNLLFKRLFMNDIDVHFFAHNAVEFMRDKRFNGINIYWDAEPTSQAKYIYTRLLRALRIAIRTDVSSYTKLLLTISAQAYVGYVSLVYDVPEIESLVDYVIVMAYMFKTPDVASFSAPLFASTHRKINSTLNVNAAVVYWNQQGLSYSKMLLGLSARGNMLKLVNFKVERHPGAPITSEAIEGKYYHFKNGLAYPEVCNRFVLASRYYDSVQKIPYLVRGYEFIGYEDKRSLSEKLNYMQEKGLAGVAFNNMDEDDFNASWCELGKFPLLSHMKQTLVPPLTTPTPRTTPTRTDPAQPFPDPVTAPEEVTTPEAATIPEYTGHFTYIPQTTLSEEEVNTTRVSKNYSRGNIVYQIDEEKGIQVHSAETGSHSLKVFIYGVMGFVVWSVLVTIVIIVRRDTAQSGNR
ncbi:hypothetical protein BsWGS_24746 [Bradybaena similaris]